MGAYKRSNEEELRQQFDDTRERQAELAIDFSKPLSEEQRASSLRGKTLLCTGGASGLGAAFVTAFARSSDDTAVILADLDATKGVALQDSLRAEGRAAIFIQTDVTRWESQLQLFRGALTWLNELAPGQERSIDHVICSAGITTGSIDLEPRNPAMLFQNYAPPKAPKTGSIAISVIGSMYTTQLALKYGMGLHKDHQPGGDRSITLLASQAGFNGITLSSDYTASKWGVRGLWRSLLNDHDHGSVRINLLAPYYTLTPLIARIAPVLEARGVKFASVDDVEAAAMRLVSDSSIHGRAVSIDEGGAYDIRDDWSGGFGAKMLEEGIKEGRTLMPTTQVSRARL